jgi:hypothetical protein
MSKSMRRQWALIDSEGVAWVIATLSDTRLRVLVREYQKQGITLTPKAVA